MYTDPFSLNRRSFLKRILLGTAGIAALRVSPGCKPTGKLDHIKGSITGANHATGHLLRNIGQLPQPVSTIETDVLIIGGGISGLSARRWLTKYSNAKVLLLEMDNSLGGNAQYHRNRVTAYPLGAHYLPIPDIRNTELIGFLQECGSITGITPEGLPVYNDYHLCSDPEERLFINGYWQEGLVPDTGISTAEKAQIGRFFKEIEQWKLQKGTDGLDVFAIPVYRSSSDGQFQQLHQISFAQYLHDHQYTAPALLWYLEYSCKDDYGADLEQTSAWAGLHYFASRKGKAANATSASLLTWPEGNGFLVDQLKKAGSQEMRTNMLVYEVRETADGPMALCYDVAAKKSIVVKARKMILATPVSVNKRLLKDNKLWQQLPVETFRHAPWVIANLTINGLPQGKGMSLCWDNVLYGSRSVGYVNANHQQLNESPEKVITCYWPLVSNDPGKKRREIYEKGYKQWLEEIVGDLEKAHPGIAKFITDADIWLWGHGMIMPAPGLMNGSDIKKAAMPIGDHIFFAHTDLSGISIFEEAFYQGINAAKQVISVL